MGSALRKLYRLWCSTENIRQWKKFKCTRYDRYASLIYVFRSAAYDTYISYVFQFDPLVWEATFLYGVYKSVRHRPDCANSSSQCGKYVNYAQTMCKPCVNSSCQFVSMWTLIGTHSCTRLDLFVNNAWTSREQCSSLPVRVPKMARLATTKSWPKVVQVSN